MVGREWTRTMGPTVAITFDFHNTLARCDRWFELEVRELVPAFLRWNARRIDGDAPSAAVLEAGRVAYAAIRVEVGRIGMEQDAVACLAAILPELGLAVPVEHIRRGVDELMAETFDDDVVPLPGVVETIRYLGDEGVRLGVVSSAVYSPFLLWSLDRFGILGQFCDVLTSADAGYYKSHPGIYETSARRLGAEPSAIVHVGDSFRFDVEGARSAGQRTVWLQGDRPVPDGIPADLTVANLVDAGPALLRLARAASRSGQTVDA